jgi:hypothetical protein
VFRYVTHPKQLAATKAAKKAKVTGIPSAGLPNCFAYQPGVRRFCVCSGGSGGRRRLRHRLGREAYDWEVEASEVDVNTVTVDSVAAAVAARRENDGFDGPIGDDHEGDDGHTMRTTVIQDEEGLLEPEETQEEEEEEEEEGEKEESLAAASETGKPVKGSLPPPPPSSSAAALGHRPSSSPLMLMLVAASVVTCTRATGNGVALTTRATTSLSVFTLGSLLLVLGTMVPSTDAHNWVPTPGRNWGGASTTKPCKVRKVTDTHQQIGPGQTFALGFQTGHGSKHYLIVVHGDDEHWLAHPKLLTYV